MSSYIRDYINPKTGKHQVCYCIDDYFRQHVYGYCFLKDGSDASWDEFGDKFSYKDKCDIYTWEEIQKAVKTIDDVILMFNHQFPELYGSFEPCDGWNPSEKEDVIDFIKEYLVIYENNNRTNKRVH